MDDDRMFKLIMKIDEKLDRVAEKLPTLATKTEHDDLRDVVNDFKSKVKAFGMIGALGAAALKFFGFAF